MKTEWYENRDELLAFARHLADEGEFGNDEELIEDVLYFFEKPWKWDKEYTEWKYGPAGGAYAKYVR